MSEQVTAPTGENATEAPKALVAKKVKVKLLRDVILAGDKLSVAGTVAEVTEEKAKELCTPRQGYYEDQGEFMGRAKRQQICVAERVA